MNNKGQASLEFMYTYGWAIAVTIIALGALVYIVSTDTFVSDACYTSGELGCEDYALAENDLKLNLSNNIGKEITLESIECKYGESVMTQVYTTVVPSGGNFEVLCRDIAVFPLNKKAKVTFIVFYTESGKSFATTTDGYVVTTPI